MAASLPNGVRIFSRAGHSVFNVHGDDGGIAGYAFYLYRGKEPSGAESTPLDGEVHCSDGSQRLAVRFGVMDTAEEFARKIAAAAKKLAAYVSPDELAIAIAPEDRL